MTGLLSLREKLAVLLTGTVLVLLLLAPLGLHVVRSAARGLQPREVAVMWNSGILNGISRLGQSQ